MPTVQPSPPNPEPRFRTAVVQYFVHLMLLFLCAPSLAPAVNESHYLPKAKHAWDSSFASGGDLFLDSHDSHFLATAFAGIAARALPLAAVAWLGRLVSWMLLAYAWSRWCQSLRIRPLLQPILLIAWFLATQFGHWAGEWAIGGFEAKSIAYPLAILGLAALNEQRWPSVWLWLGAAVAWHPVVGGWVGLSVGIVWLVQLAFLSRQRAQMFWQSLPWQGLAVLIGCIGVVPAAQGLGGSLASAGNISPAAVHVFFRLAHHMSPQTFAAERHSWAIASLLVFVVLTAVWIVNRKRVQTRSAAASSSPVNVILAIAWVSIAISLIGLSIDLGLSRGRPDLASQLLRFYWFRWSDIAVPLAWTTTAIVLLQTYAFPTESARHASPQGGYVIGIVLIAVCLLLGLHVNENLNRQYPPADEMLMKVTGPWPIETDRHRDWVAVCEWIDENTPPDSLWFTPKYQQTFKWYAGRSEVVCWKDVPQDNASVVEWYRRVLRCKPPQNGSTIRDWETAELLALSKEYGFRWILLDRTYQSMPPALEYLYPLDIENPSFAVFRIPE